MQPPVFKSIVAEDSAGVVMFLESPRCGCLSQAFLDIESQSLNRKFPNQTPTCSTGLDGPMVGEIKYTPTMVVGRTYSAWLTLDHAVMCVPDIGMPMTKSTKFLRQLLPSHIWRLIQQHQVLQDNLAADPLEVSDVCFACGQANGGVVRCSLCMLPSHAGFPETKG